jgi:hypothetical protein
VFHFPGDAVRALAYSRDFALRPEPDDPKLERPDLSEDKVAASWRVPPAGFLAMPQALALLLGRGPAGGGLGDRGRCRSGPEDRLPAGLSRWS